MKTAREYTIAVRDSLRIYRPWVYDGKEGALRLAREYGAGLADSLPEQAEKEMRNSLSYNDICVIGYDLKPPLNVSEWQQEVRFSYEDTIKEKGIDVTWN